MFKEKKGQVMPPPPQEPAGEPVMAVGDMFEFSVFANEGFGIIDQISGESGLSQGTLHWSKDVHYLVKQDSTALLPVIGKLKVAGLTRTDLEDTLKAAYSDYYQEPFVQVRLSNRRVSVFPRDGEAKVIPLSAAKTTLLEVLAAAGGLDENSHASRVKLFRQEKNERKAYLIDFSTLDGLKYADIIVQSNDYIYVEPVRRTGQKIIRDIAPYISLTSSAIVLVVSIVTLTKN